MKKWTKVHQNSSGYATHQYPNAAKFGLAPTKNVEIFGSLAEYAKVRQIQGVSFDWPDH